MIARTTHKRYANVKDYEAFRDGKSLGYFQTDAKTEELEKEQIQGIVEISKCDKLFVRWTARGGHCWEEVII